MSKRKGLSAEEKRKKLLDLFHESLDFFQLKEIEKIAPKQKGIIAQSVKDVVQSLVDDGLVDMDKIGTSTYYWSYPSKARKRKEQLLNDKKIQLDEREKKLKNIRLALDNAKVGREESNHRTAILGELLKQRMELVAVEKEMLKYGGCDPKILQLLRDQSQIAKDAANRWIDNIFIIKHWCTSKYNIEEDKLNKEFGIPSDLDYMN